MSQRLILIIALTCAPAVFAKASQKGEVAPSEGMRKYAESLSFLLQNMGAPAARDQAIEKQVKQHLSNLMNISHEIQDTMLSMATDPLMRYLSLDIPQQFSRIEEAYSKGNPQIARQLLRNTSQYCLACHSSSASKHSSALQFSDPMPNLPPLEKAEYFSATRQHEKALLVYEQLLSQNNIARSEPQTWLSAISNMIALTVRMRQSPHLSLETSSRFLQEAKKLTGEQQAMLRAWRQSAQDWVAEGKQERKVDELLKHAQSLLAKGHNKNQSHSTHGFVDYLRVMNAVNELVMRTDQAALRAGAFRLAGQAMEKMAGVYVWMRPDVYYEACIRSHPKSKEASRCWQDLSSHLQISPEALQKLPWYQNLQSLVR